MAEKCFTKVEPSSYVQSICLYYCRSDSKASQVIESGPCVYYTAATSFSDDGYFEFRAHLDLIRSQPGFHNFFLKSTTLSLTTSTPSRRSSSAIYSG